MIIELTHQNIKDVNNFSQTFEVIGKIIPTFFDGKWTFTEHLYDKPYEKTYLDDEINIDEYINNKDKILFFYYDNSECVGQIRLSKIWNNNALIEDFAVAKSHRNKGIGKQLIQKAIEWAKQRNLLGLMLETQDNNLSACRFYDKLSFVIGAVDVMYYANFDTADEKAVFWYMKF